MLYIAFKKNMITECINTTEKDVSQEFRLKEKKGKKKRTII